MNIGPMNKCLRITIFDACTLSVLNDFVQKLAQSLGLEGTARLLNDTQHVLIVVCGNKDNVDSFLDILHKGVEGWVPEDLEIEPFLKDRDYRGVFRVIS